MLLGALVIIVVGVLVINFFSQEEGGESIPPIGTEDESVSNTYTVQEGEDLWTISEKVYGTGYNWPEIASANNLENPSEIEAGQELVIPNLQTEDGQTPTIALTDEPTATLSPVPTVIEEIPTPTEMEATEDADAIAGNSYTVVQGDSLWHIAVRAYGDGYKWVEIAQENNLENPDLIHPGNVFVLPQ